MVAESVFIIATLTLFIELAVLGLLTFGYYAQRSKKYRRHGITMTTAVPLHLATILGWMIWSLNNFLSASSVNFGSLLVLATLGHVVLGAIAVSLGVWLVSAWHLQTDVQKCFPRKRFMIVTITTWATAITLGIILYITVILS
jgi:predicted transporter